MVKAEKPRLGRLVTAVGPGDPEWVTRGKPLLLFGAASLLAVGIGAWVCAQSGVSASIWGQNLAAWLVGAIVAAGLARTGGRLLPFAVAAAPLALAATFLSDGLEGVHRWIEAGPVRLNAALLVLPAGVVALAAESSRRGWAVALLGLGLLARQPDASQASAYGASIALVAALRGPGPWTRVGLVLACAVLVGVAWLPADPLKPVPEVEGIIGLAFQLSPILGALALASLAATVLAGPVATRKAAPDVRLAGAALGVWLTLTAAAPFVGAFPVPLVGIGLSPILGVWLGVGLLAGLSRPQES